MRVLFVCLGNICRSPLAEGVAREILRRDAPWAAVTVDSAGTAGYHLGAPPDARAQAAAASRGFNSAGHRARAVTRADFDQFELILAMDHANLAALQALAPRSGLARVQLLLDLAPRVGVREVPDPYYGGPEDFEQVLNLVEQGTRGLIEYLRNTAAVEPPR